MPKYNPLIQSLPVPESKSFIYALCDLDNNIRYVGQTMQGLLRIKEHFFKCHITNKNTGFFPASKKWIKSLKDNNQIFHVKYLEYCSIESLNEREKYWLKFYKDQGIELLNHEDGGTRDNMTYTSEQRKMISRRTKEAMSKLDRSAMAEHARNTIAGYNKGKKFSQEFKDKISKKVIDQDGNIYRSCKDAAEAIGFNKANMARNIKKSWPCNGKIFKYYEESNG